MFSNLKQLATSGRVGRNRNSYYLPYVSVLIFVAAFFAHYSPIDASRLVKSGLENLTVANHLAEERRFASPFDTVETGPSAHVSPGFPIVVASTIEVFGNGAKGAYALRLLTVSVFGLQLALFPLLASQLRVSPMVGLISALLQLIGGYVTPNWEVNYVALLLILLAVSTLGIPESGLSISRALGLGLIWALLLLFGSIVVLCFPLYLLWLSRFKKSPIRSIFLLTLTSLLLISPWLIRNYLVFRQTVFIRDNLGVELATSNNDCASYSFNGNIDNGCYTMNHPNASLAQATMVRSLGEVNYNRQRLLEASAWIRTHPATYAKLCVKRLLAFWFPWEQKETITVERAFTWIMTLLSIWGLRRLAALNKAGFWYLLIWLTTFPIAYYFVVAFEDRHRIPIIWVTFLPATLAILQVLGFKWNSLESAEDPALSSEFV